MARIIEGRFDVKDKRIGIVAARFNDFIVSRLVDAALGTLSKHGIDEKAVTVAWVPGAWEIPVAVKKMADSGNYDVLITLGCVIRGATPHFDYVAGECAKGCSSIALQTGIPVLFGVLTTDTIEQAIERAGTKAGNKGADAATAALEMLSLLEQL